MDPNGRYIRQVVLPEIGLEGQEKLSQASVLCVGAGGLGSPILLYLAAAGVGHIGITDFDTVDESNLQRQVLFTTDAVGQSKAVQAKKRLQALNPTITIEIYEEGLNAENAPDLFQSYDIIIDGTDNFETKFLINDAAVKYGKPWIYGAIQGFYGQASVFNAQHGPCYRCLYPAPPKARIANCAEAGVIGAVAGLVGVTQALQAIQLITGHESFEPLIGKLWTLDTKTMETRILTLPKNPDCPACSQNREDVVLQYKSPVCGFIPEVFPEQVCAKTESLLVDVRELEEWECGAIPGAQHWPLSEALEGFIPDFPQDKEIILYCQKGMRSLQAAQILKERGFLDVYNLTGGYDAWLTASSKSETKA